MSIAAFARLVGLALSTFVLTCAFIFCPQAGAGSLETILDDFSPVDGYVVMVRDSDVIIDLDASKGIVEGDLFGVVSKGEEIVHPVTGKVIGNLEGSKATIRVTRLKSGYSHTRALGPIDKVAPGDPIRRYENVKALFWDYTGQGAPLYAKLRDELNQMDWEQYEACQAKRPSEVGKTSNTVGAVVFIYDGSKLQVRGPEFSIFREYVFTEPVTQQDLLAYTKRSPVAVTPKAETPPVAAHAPAQPSAQAVPAVPQASVPPAAVESVKPVYEATGASEERYAPVMAKKEGKESKGVEPVFQESDIVEQLPGAPVIMSDFLPYERGLLLAVTDGKEIRIFKIDGAISSVTKMETPLHDPILSISWWVPDSSESPMLAVVHFTENQPVGSIYELDGNRLRLKTDKIKRFIGAFDADGDRIPEMLLGQKYDPEDFFDYKIHELKLAGGEIDYRIPTVTLPNRFTVAGGLLADLTDDGKPESVFIRDEILYVYSGIDAMFKSPKQLGGTIDKIVYEVDPTAKQIRTKTVSFEIPPVAADLDGDGTKELLAVAAERSLLAHTGMSPGIKETWLAVLKYEDGSFEQGTLGKRINTPIQGLTVHDGKVIMVVSETGSVFSGGGKSRIVELPLAR